MKRLIVLVAFVLGAVLLPSTVVDAGMATGSVTFVNAITYDAENDMPMTICVDGDLIVEDLSTTEFFGPVDIAAGTYVVDFMQDTDCADDPFASGSVTIEPGADATIMGWWGVEGRDVTLFDNDLSCTESSRFTLRHGAATDAVDMSVTPDGGSSTEVISDLAPGDQQAADLAVGAYEGGEITESSSEDPIVDLGPDTIAVGEVRVAYLFGGADGAIGIFFAPVVVTQCETPSSSSTTSSTSPAAAAATQPRFTG
jgi:hypothetical protein